MWPDLAPLEGVLFSGVTGGWLGCQAVRPTHNPLATNSATRHRSKGFDLIFPFELHTQLLRIIGAGDPDVTRPDPFRDEDGARRDEPETD